MKLNIKIYLDFFRSEILQEKKLKSTNKEKEINKKIKVIKKKEKNNTQKHGNAQKDIAWSGT